MRRPVFTLAFFLAAAPAFAQTPLTGDSGLPASNTRPLSGTAVAPGPAAGPSSASPATETAPPARSRGPHAHGAHRPLAERFAAANTTHDGHLTLAQARAAKMNEVVRDFGLIDKDKKGYVTVDGIKDFRRSRRAARAAEEAR
jgi:hypothetical protein